MEIVVVLSDWFRDVASPIPYWEVSRSYSADDSSWTCGWLIIRLAYLCYFLTY